MTITYASMDDVESITFVSYIEFGSDGLAHITTYNGDEIQVPISDLQEVIA